MFYLEQYERVRRFLARIERQNREATEYKDDLYSFFLNCWHLKDWIKNDPGVPKGIRDRIECEVSQYENIMICADLANRIKHLELKKCVRKDAKLKQNIRICVPM